MSEAHVERRLAVGAVLGLLVAAVGVLRTSEGDGRRVPTDAIAVVDGRSLSRADYERRLAALGSDRKSPLTDADRRRVLERMIDEELLLGRALELGLPSRDPQARKDLVGAIVDAIVATAPAEDPGDDELRAFHEANRDRFAPESRFRLRSLWFRIVDPLETAASEARAGQALDALAAGEPFASVASRLADVELAPLPETPLPLAKVVEYLGPSAARAAAALAPGERTEPIRTSGGIRIVELVDRTTEAPGSFDELRPRILSEWRRRRDERALADAVAELRAGSRITVAPDAPRGAP